MQPMLASPGRTLTDAVKYAVSDDWELTPKMDGERLILATVDGALRAWTRSGKETDPPPTIKFEIASLPGVAVLDGEKIGDTFIVFDAPLNDCNDAGPINEDTPLSERRLTLQRLFKQWQPDPRHVRLVPSAVNLDDKAEMIRAVDEGRGEGLVAKQLDSLYTFGHRSRDWVKLKRHHTIDCVVAWLGTEKHNMGLAVHRDGQFIEVGEVGTLTGQGLQAKVGDVVEVKVLYASDAGRLVQPTKPMLRHDKQPEECDWGQIEAASTNKNLVLEMEPAA